MKQTQTLPLSSIISNPYRDFDLYPVEQGLVDVLKASYNPENGGRDFGTIAVRPVGNGQYEQVFGHHRIEAMRQLGITEARFLVENVDDDQMVREMVAENAAQKGGSFQSQVDSVAAVIRRLAYWLLICENAEQWNEAFGIYGSAVADAKTPQGGDGFTKAKKNLLSEGSIGQPLISQFAPTMGQAAIAGALAQLKSMGLMGAIIAKVQAQVDAEIEAKTRAEKARAAAAEKARKEAEEAHQKALKAAKDAAAAAAKANAAKKAQAEADAKVAADRAAKMEVARREVAAKEAAARQKAEQESAARRAASAAAAEAHQAAEEQKRYLHPEMRTILSGERHQRAVLAILKKNDNLKYFPIPEQPEIFRTIYATAQSAFSHKSKDDVTALNVEQGMRDRIAAMDVRYREMQEQAAKLRQAESKSVKAQALLNELRASMGRFDNAVFAIGEACHNDPELATIIYGDIDFKMSGAVDAMEKTVEAMRKNFGIKSRRGVIKKEEKVIGNYTDFKQVN